ncbi:glyoxalase [Streptomyces sp. CB01635]|nr:glyoxalase [Streptomyces sp. CB01635]
MSRTAAFGAGCRTSASGAGTDAQSSDPERSDLFWPGHDDNSAVFEFGNTIINLLKTTAAPDLIEPARVAQADAGSRLQLTLPVDDVDAMCWELAARGVTLLNGPTDRPWGIRTASFRDPGGHIWEIAK